MKNYLAVFLFLFTASASCLAGEEPGVPAKRDLNILTYNIKCLPRILLNHAQNPIKRVRLIPQKLINDTLDVIVFQEAFDAKARRILKRGLSKEFPYMIKPANLKPGFKVSSGVMMFSRFPIVKLGEIEFTTCDGSDCMARKGGLLCEVSLPGKKIQVLGTHAEAGGSFEMKVGQFYQLRELMNKFYSEDVPQIACGDFNAAHSNKPLYDTLITILDVENGPLSGEMQFTGDHMLNDLHPFNPERRNEIDYIFLRFKKLKPAFVERSIVRYIQRWHKSHCDLSDHFAVKMKMIF